MRKPLKVNCFSRRAQKPYKEKKTTFTVPKVFYVVQVWAYLCRPVKFSILSHFTGGFLWQSLIEVNELVVIPYCKCLSMCLIFHVHVLVYCDILVCILLFVFFQFQFSCSFFAFRAVDQKYVWPMEDINVFKKCK